MPGALTNMASIVGAGGSAQPTVIGRAATILDPAATKLGMSVDDLKKALKQGTTLSKLAADKGVSHLDLVSTIKQGLISAGVPQATPIPRRGKAGANDGDTDDTGDNVELQKLAQEIATGTSPKAAKSSKRTPLVNEPDTRALGRLSDLLQMQPKELVASLTAGAKLTDLADAKGVSSDQVLASVTAGMVLRTTA